MAAAAAEKKEKCVEGPSELTTAGGEEEGHGRTEGREEGGRGHLTAAQEHRRARVCTPKDEQNGRPPGRLSFPSQFPSFPAQTSTAIAHWSSTLGEQKQKEK